MVETFFTTENLLVRVQRARFAFCPLYFDSLEYRVESTEWRVQSGEYRVESTEWRVQSGDNYHCLVSSSARSLVS